MSFIKAIIKKMSGGVLLKIIDTVPFFLKYYESSLAFLKHYYSQYPKIFNEYFAYHCKDTEERHDQSLAKYPESLLAIQQVRRAIIPIIEEVVEEYGRLYQVTFPTEVNLIVGGYGSNAYTHRQIIPDVTFALERLSPKVEHLQAIVAHDFGHVAHNILSSEAGMDWGKVQWDSPLIWLYQEGAAIHFSRQIAPQLPPAMYFSFDAEGEEWLRFFKENTHAVKSAFAHDYVQETSQSMFQEWFSINGGKRFGYNRLGYLVGDLLFQHFTKTKGERNAITAWKEGRFREEVERWFKR